jgi:hypothetical protein
MPRVNLTLDGDPDIGTLVHSDALTDATGQPLEPKLDACLRDALDQLELPPLKQGQQLKIQYSFRFD